MLRRAFLATVALVAVPALAPVAARAADDGKKKKAGGATFIPIETLTGATNRADGRRGVLTVECGLDVRDGGLRQLANQSMPRLRAAYVQTVITYAAGLPPGAAPSADFLAMAMQRQTDAVLGRPGARFLLGAILVN